MKLVEIKQLKENEFFKKIIEELNVKGLDKLYIKKTDKIDYLDIIIAITNFLELNKNVFKKLSSDNHEKLVLIVLVEILEEINIDTDEEQLEKIIILLKNSLLVQKVSNFVFTKLKIIYSKLNICCKSDDTVDSIHVEIKQIEKSSTTKSAESTKQSA